MRSAARYAAAIEVLEAWLTGAPIEQLLTRWARGARYAGSKDRAAVRDIVFDVLRCKDRCAAAGGAETGRTLVLGLLRLQDVDPDTVFTGEGHAPDILSDQERASGAASSSGVDLPAWMGDVFDPSLKENAPALVRALSDRAPVWVRVNTRRATPDAAKAALEADGIIAVPSEQLPTALRLDSGARRLRQARAYVDGLVEVQDLSPNLAVASLDLPRAGRLLDFCAGGGGKALALADRTDAAIFAHDANPSRMKDIAPRAARAGVTITELQSSDVSRHAPFDMVVTDVPCSGSGTWRRDPETKWRLQPERLDELVRLQADILDQAAGLVAQNGQLVYMTCSLFDAENRAQIEGFLERNPQWTCVADHLLTPLTASDGFFSAVLTRA